MNKTQLTYLFIFGLIGLNCTTVYAGTDLLANALTQSNSFLKEAALVQQKYSTIARKIVTAKVGLDPEKLGGERVKKAKEKLESTQEQIAKVQERIDHAVDMKNELTDKYNKLNEAANAYAAQAAGYIEEGKEIQKAVKNYKEQAENMLDKAKGMADQAKDVVNQADEALKEAKSGENTGERQTEEQPEEPASEPAPVSETVSEPVSVKETRPAAASNSNQASAIATAGQLVQDMAAEEPAVMISGVLPEISADTAAVSVSDILTKAEELKDKAPEPAAEVKSNLTLHEQLEQLSGRADTKTVAPSAAKKLINLKPAAVRSGFAGRETPAVKTADMIKETNDAQ